MREEEEAYTAQSIVLPIRRLAACADTMAENDALTGDRPCFTAFSKLADVKPIV
jgi:hypothetical protein